MTPPRLDGVADSWAAFVCSVPHSQRENISLHIDGSHSVYELRFTFITAAGSSTFYYIGDTARPTKRPSEHVSEFMRCSVKTSHGKSKLYDPKYIDGLIAIEIAFAVLVSGYATKADAGAHAREVAKQYATLYTQEFMLSNQNRGRGKDRRPRFSRKKLSL